MLAVEVVESRRAAIVPHAPLLVMDNPRSRGDSALERVRAASREVARVVPGTLVVVSPHARRTGVYLSTRGGLRAFGVARADATCRVDADLSARVADRWGRPVVGGPLDHGITVPLELLGHEGPVVAIGIAEDEADVEGAARTVAEALRPLDASILASVNSGAGVTGRGPLTELPGGVALEEELGRVLRQDVAGLHELTKRLATLGGSCSLGPLLVLAHLLPGRSMQVLAHEWPVGVGYPVARTEGPC